ncbi:hypothetical protein HN51_043137 [Arachis hypogaea]
MLVLGKASLEVKKRKMEDAKSDHVKQLLKETEKYLQKLCSKLQEAKTAASRFEHDIDEAQCGSFLDKSESSVENEDKSDQAKLKAVGPVAILRGLQISILSKDKSCL